MTGRESVAKSSTSTIPEDTEDMEGVEGVEGDGDGDGAEVGPATAAAAWLFLILFLIARLARGGGRPASTRRDRNAR
jgi:hypothetical protein